jgi:hypothetical protein
MDFNSIVKALAENTLGALLAISIVYMFYRVLSHILTQQEHIMKMAITQNEHWQGVIAEHTASAKSFHEEVKEAHKCQRIEHNELAQVLARINGYKS